MHALPDNKYQIASHLNAFATVLEQSSLLVDVSGIYTVANRLFEEPEDSAWQYSCDKLKFPVNGTMSGCIPQNVNFYEVILSITVGGFYVVENDYKNPLEQLQIDIEIAALTESGELYSTWHFDKHKGETEEASYYCHPEYHWTFGGNLMEGANRGYGDCIILPTPRIAYPPMDLILSVDFVIQNYISLENRRKLMQAPEYRAAVENSQLRLWRPYFASLASRWHAVPDVSFGSERSYHEYSPLIPFEAAYR